MKQLGFSEIDIVVKTITTEYKTAEAKLNFFRAAFLRPYLNQIPESRHQDLFNSLAMQYKQDNDLTISIKRMFIYAKK